MSIRRRMMMMKAQAPSVVLTTGSAESSQFTVTTLNYQPYTFRYRDVSGNLVESRVASSTSNTIATMQNSTIELYGAFGSLTSYTANANVRVIDLSNHRGLLSITTAKNNVLEQIIGLELQDVTSATALYDCPSLVSVDLSRITRFGNYAMQNCASLASVDLSSVESIGDAAFYQCPSLSISELPSSVESIGRLAFLGCGGITDVTILRTASKVVSSDRPFNSGVTIRVPNALLSEYQADANWNVYNLVGY